MITPLILVLPLAAAMALAVLAGKRRAKYVALAGSIASLLLLPLIGYGTQSIGWFSIPQLAGQGKAASIQITTMVTSLNMLLLIIILTIAPLIMLYSFGYMENLDEQRRFYLEMLAFEASMLAFAMSGNLILIFIAWEFLSLTSYLLIGFWDHKPSAIRAARKAITTVLIGDLAILAAIALLWNAYGTFSFAQIFSSATTSPSAYLAAALLLVAIFTKSAQFPFNEWLPDAMEGPTPVSAFLHSTTMVKAGVFAFIIMLPLFIAMHLTHVVMIVSALTLLLATLNAMREPHLKKVIAYSTMGELSLMLLAFSGGAIAAGIYFFFAQSFYKALLFFGSGAAMKANGEESDLNKVSGMKGNRLVYITTLFGVLALAGFIPFDGFFANVGIGASFASNIIAYILISAVALMTSFYIFRWFLLISKEDRSSSSYLNYKIGPKSMAFAMVPLAAMTIAASYIYFYFPSFLSNNASYLSAYIGTASIPLSITEGLIESAIIAGGAAISYAVYKKKIGISQRLAYYAARNGLLVNAAYSRFALFVYDLAEGVTLFDIYLDSAFDMLAGAASASGERLRRMATGNVNAYAMIFSIGAIAITVFAYLVGK